jgi:hypothetical protein
MNHRENVPGDNKFINHQSLKNNGSAAQGALQNGRGIPQQTLPLGDQIPLNSIHFHSQLYLLALEENCGRDLLRQQRDAIFA